MKYAEVIGDPIAHSLSPAIHLHWLQVLGLGGRFSATSVTAADLPCFIDQRRGDADWAGCSVTSPHKETIVPLLDMIDERARHAGAVNCVFRDGDALVGSNTDLDGLARALDDVAFTGAKVVVIGAGGAARAALSYLRTRRPGEIVLLVRDADRAAPLLAKGTRCLGFQEAGEAMAGARLIVNAAPLGMAGSPLMPAPLLSALGAAAEDAAVMDMVYSPVETPLLAAAGAQGLRAIDGLHMLIGQARPAFRRFFGAEPPGEDEELRAILVGRGR
ncbi:MAG TPA: shikimate dehydrogenase [Allosphingosinicella sp.]|nr:shikimate dehydrogenase [Allosphingosinicella sp.]